jgi:hypothetical protein
MGAAARAHIEAAWPSWEDVVRDDLLPIWEACSHRPAQEARRDAVSHVRLSLA